MPATALDLPKAPSNSMYSVVIGDLQKLIPKESDARAEYFTESFQHDTLAVLAKVQSIKIPAQLPRLLIRTTIMEKLQTIGRLAFGLDSKDSLTLNVAVMSDTAVQPQDRIMDRITPSQVVDVQASTSDMTSEADGSGI